MSNLPKATAGGGSKHRRHLSNFLLDKGLQLRYVAFVTVLSAIISGSLGYLIWQQESLATKANLETFDDMIAAEVGDAKQPWIEIREEAKQQMESGDSSLILTMAGAGVGLVIVLSLFLVVMTHKVAGPLFKVSNYFDKMREGRLGDVWPLRRFDMLKEFYGSFSDMHKAVRARAVEANELVGRFLTACEAAGVGRDAELGHQLDELEAYKNKRDDQLA